MISYSVDDLIKELKKLSPMPADDDSTLTPELLAKYGEIIDCVYHLVSQSVNTENFALIKPLICSFGFGDAYEAYWPVIHALEKFPSEILRPALCEAALKGERGARWWSIYMLGRQHNSEDVSTLVRALGDPDPLIRRNALKALGMMGDLRASSAMEKLLSDSDLEVRRAAHEHLAKLVD